MKNKKRLLSGFLAVFLCVAMNINPVATIGIAFLESEFAKDLGIAGKNIIYMLSNPDVVNATEATDPTLPPEPLPGASGGSSCSCSFECEFDDTAIIEAIEEQTKDYEEALDEDIKDIKEFQTLQVETLNGTLEDINKSVGAVNSTLKNTIHKDLQDIKDQIALQQHQYRVAHLYSLNNKIGNVLWRPTIEEVDYAKDYAYITGKFANIYDGYWNTNVTTVNKGNSGAQRALEVLGYDALVRREGVIISGGFGMIEVDGQKTYGWVSSPGHLESEAWNNKQYDGYTDAYELRDRSMDSLRALYYQELIPEEEITWLDAVTLLYKAVGEEVQSFESFMVHDSSVTPETSPAYQNLSDIVPGYTNPKTGVFNENEYNGYNMYMFFSRSNIVYSADEEGKDIGHTDYYWNKAMADGFVMRDNADVKIKGDELFILASRIMQTYGEPELNQDEIDALLQVYGKDYPVQLGEDVANAWAYLMVRGCLEADISYTGFVDRNQILDLAMRIADVDSRTDYKNIQVTLDLADVMISDGWYPVRDLEYTTSASVEMKLDYTIQTHYDYLIRKGEKMSDGKDLKFVSANGVEATDLIVSTDMGAKHNVAGCVGTNHNVSVVSDSKYMGVVTIAGREYYHIRIPKDAGIGTGFKIYGIISDADGKEVPATNAYAMIPSNMIGGGIYGSWTTDGDGIKATISSFQTFDQINSNSVYKYTDCIRALDVDVQAQRKLADASDRTILEYLAYQWDRLTTPMYVSATSNVISTTTDLQGSGGGGGASTEVSLTWTPKGGSEQTVSGGFDKVSVNGDKGSYNYYHAQEGNSGVARAFRLSMMSIFVPYIMEHYEGNLLEDIKSGGLTVPTSVTDAIGKDFYTYQVNYMQHEDFSNSVVMGTSSNNGGRDVRYNTYARKYGPLPDGVPEGVIDDDARNYVQYPGAYWLYAFINAYTLPIPDKDFQGQINLDFEGKVISTAQSGWQTSLGNHSWYQAAVSDYNDIREFYQVNGLRGSDSGWSISETSTGGLKITGQTATSDKASAILGEFLSNGSSSSVNTGQAAVGTYDDIIDESVFSSTVMNRDQNILISFTDLKKAGFIDPSTDKPVAMSDGAYYLETPKGVVRVNDKTKMISVGGTLYNLANDDGTGPTIAYEDPTQGEWYFDYRCFMGVIETNVYPTDGGECVIQGDSIGCAGSVIYTMGDGEWGSSLFNTVSVNCYNFPDIDSISKVTNTGTYTVDIISSYANDGGKIKDGANNTGEYPYWDSMPAGSYRLSMSTFNPTANYILVTRQTDDMTASSVFVWYPKRAFTDGFIDSGGNVVSSVNGSKFIDMEGWGGDGGYGYAWDALMSCNSYGSETITSLLNKIYPDTDFRSAESIKSLQWYEAMTVGAAAHLYDWSMGGFYLSADYVIREFPLTWDNANGNSLSIVKMPYGFADGGADDITGTLNSNRVGACYWLKGVGYVYNLPTIDQWTMEGYLSGSIMLPYAVAGNSPTSFKVINYNMDSYGNVHLASKKENVGGLPYGVAYADAGIVPWTILKSGSNSVYNGYTIDLMKDGTSVINPTSKSSNDASGKLVYAPSGVYIYFGGNQLVRGKVKDMTGFITNANSVYIGSRRIEFDKIDNNEYFFKIGSEAYDSVSVGLDTEFYRVHHAYNGSDVWIAANADITRNDIGELNPVDIFDNYPNPLKNAFDGLGLDSVIDAIDQGSSLIILFAFKVLPIIGILVMTFLIGISFISNTRFAQRICEKTIDPIRILTLGHRDINNWDWRKVLIPCTILYISFALFLNGNIIRVIEWLAELYGVVSRWARNM